MLLQYPKLSNSADVARYEDYRKSHQDFMKVYKLLYGEVSSFSLIPERFIQQAEPVIDAYLARQSNRDVEQRIALQAITDFISNFYTFMDEATEMFTEHQALAGHTMKYLEKVSFLNRKNQDRCIRECEGDYLQMMPELNDLKEILYMVRDKLDTTSRNLNRLKPVWERIKDKISQPL
jgi:hypothetical protein